MTKSFLTDLTYQVNGAAIEVHKFSGPWLLESVYHKCLKRELDFRGISYKSELLVPINFKGLDVDTNLRCDFFIENCVVLELKAVEEFAPIHHAQLLTYMKLLEAPKGILYNFYSVNLYKEGQKTLVNEYYRLLAD